MLFPEVTDFEIGTESTRIGIDFKFVNGQHILQKDGDLQECTEVENYGQWIAKVVTTQKDIYVVYTRDETEKFGTDLESHLGTKHRSYWLSELQREITEQLLKNKNITAVKNYKAEFARREVQISFTVVTASGINIDYSSI